MGGQIKEGGKKQGSSVGSSVVISFLIFSTILFCYSLSSSWFNYSTYVNSSLQDSIFTSSHKPLPPPPSPLLPPPPQPPPMTIPSQLQNSTQESEFSIKSPPPQPLPPPPMTIPSQFQNSTQKSEFSIKSPPPQPPIPPPPPMTILSQLQNSTKKSEFSIKSPPPPPPPPPMTIPSQLQNSTKKSEFSIKSPPPSPMIIPSQLQNSTQQSEFSIKSPPPPPPMTIPSQLQNSSQISEFSIPPPPPPPPPNPKEYPLMCTTKGTSQTCPNNYPRKHTPTNPNSPSTCPEYFRWIYEDLRAWKETGVTRAMVEGARRTAHFRLVILDGRVYVEKYRKSIQTRDKFTMWGFLQLLRSYPGKLPDLELMFDCDDRPVIQSSFFRSPNSDPPPLFRYCSNHRSLDIVFPDWSFWGWAETNQKPWRDSSNDIEEGNKKIKWMDRIPYAYWRGNPTVAPIRRDLLKCNLTDQFDWNTRLYVQDWDKESKLGFNESNLKDQCTHRYKIYIEGWAWSVSEKYIVECDSMALLVRPRYHEFFSRGMLPLVHYWPIRDNTMCKSLKFAVDWGNNHTDKAQEIGRAGSKYIHEDMKMELVYDYMFHLLNEYAKLLRFKPEIPPNVEELCAEKMACQEEGVWREFMEESLEKSPSNRVPCNMPPPYDPLGIRHFFEKKNNLTRQVEIWEDEYWTKFNTTGITS